jgi:hypothetical protein
MDALSLRPILAPLLGAAICFAVTPRLDVSARTPLVDRLVASAVNVTDNSYAGKIEIYIERWSSDTEFEALLGALKSGPDQLLPTLESIRYPLAILTIPGVQGLGLRVRDPWPRPLRFARQIETPAGRQIILAADRHLGLGELPRWGVSSNQEFAFVDIRFGKDGKGIGKVAAATDVAYSPVTKMFEMKDYENQAARLLEVTEEKH